MVAWYHGIDVLTGNGRRYNYTPNKPVPDAVIQDQRRAYYAAVSYVDEHIGALLDELDAQGLTDSTIVVVHGDHGYHLGEQGIWGKATNFDLAVRVPLVIRHPNKTGAMGVKTGSFVDLVDVFPTVVGLAGLPPPEGVDGEDVSRIFDDPHTPTKQVAYAQYPVCGQQIHALIERKKWVKHKRDRCSQTPPQLFSGMGYTVRDAAWRYTLWLPWDREALEARWNCLETDMSPGGDQGCGYAEELYPHEGDDSSSMDDWEHTNEVEKWPDVARVLRQQVREFFEHDASS